MTKREITKAIDEVVQAHATFSPSGYSRIMKCPGSLFMSKGIPEPPPSPYADEGTEAHDWLEKALKAGDNWEDVIADIEIPDMEEAVEGAVVYIRDAIRRLSPTKIIIEEKVRLSKKIWGRVDVALVYRNSKRELCVAVIDYKHGKGVSVQAKDNPQIIIYGLAVCKELNINPKHLTCIVYQPRIYGEDPVRKTKLTPDEMSMWREKIKHAGIKANKMLQEEIPAELEAGDHCRFCKAKAVCDTYRKHANTEDLLSLTDLPVVQEVVKLTDEQVVTILKKRKLIETFLKDVSSYAYQRADMNDAIPGTKLVEGRSQRRWSGGVQDIAEHLTALGVEDPYDRKIKGIGAIETLISEQLSHEEYPTKKSRKEQAGILIAPCVDKPAGKLSIALDADPRNSIGSGNSAQDLLDDI